MAAVAQMSYLLSLTFLPVLGLLPLLHLSSRQALPPLARCHLRQTLRAGLLVLVLQIAATLAFLLLFNVSALYGWIIVEFYFLLAGPFAVLGMIGLGKALAGKDFIYPLIGRSCDG
jgi:hypothetical protein